MPFQGLNGFLCVGTDSISARWSGCDLKAETSDNSSLILDSVVFFQIKLFHNLQVFLGSQLLVKEQVVRRFLHNSYTVLQRYQFWDQEVLLMPWAMPHLAYGTLCGSTLEDHPECTVDPQHNGSWNLRVLLNFPGEKSKL